MPQGRERIPYNAIHPDFTRIIVLLAALALLGFLLHLLLQGIVMLRDPDHDGLPTLLDPHPEEFDGELDSDGDGWSNGYERTAGRDLRDPDEDRDGLRDGEDPDGDGMSSWFEREIAGLDPNIPNHRFYVQLMSVPFYRTDEEWNRRYWLEHQGIRENDFIVRYSVTEQEFLGVVEDLSRRADRESIVYLFLLTHGRADDGAGEPVLCFANESDPSRADLCGETITYRELDALLDTIPCRRMAIAYSSCAGKSALAALEEGQCPRVVIAAMGTRIGIPSETAIEAALKRPGGYHNVQEMLLAPGEPAGNATGGAAVLDPYRIADSFYFGDLPNRVLLEREGEG